MNKGDLEAAQNAEMEEYETWGAPPADFDKGDPERVRIFGERLRYLRKKQNYSLKVVAKELGMSEMNISKYENGKIRNVPVNQLSRLAALFGVTAHYLLGYVNDENKYLRLDPHRNIVYDADGKTPRLVTQPMTIASVGVQRAISDYRDLYCDDTELFYLINKLVIVPQARKDAVKKILSIILNEM